MGAGRWSRSSRLGSRQATRTTTRGKLLRVKGDALLVGGDPTFEPDGSPTLGPYAYDLGRVGRIFVFGAAKGVQCSAKAIEDVLGDRLTGGCVIAERGDARILERVKVVYGAHPAPDEGCADGYRQTLQLSRDSSPKTSSSPSSAMACLRCSRSLRRR